jgi:hypothetical protein
MILWANIHRRFFRISKQYDTFGKIGIYMKKMMWAGLLLIFILTGCDSNKMTAVEYNNVIIDEHTKISKNIIEMAAYFETDISKSESIRAQMVSQCDSSLKKLEALPDYKGNTEFRDAGVSIFKFYLEISKNEYKEMLQILAKDDDIEMEDILRLTKIENDLATKEQALDTRFKKAQESFAKEHNFSLIENEIQGEIDQLGR